MLFLYSVYNTGMKESAYFRSIFDVVEFMIGKKLPDTGKRLIINYIESSASVTMAGRARDAVMRYTQEDIPTLDEIRQRHAVDEMSRMDHLVLKLEFQSRRLSP